MEGDPRFAELSGHGAQGAGVTNSQLGIVRLRGAAKMVPAPRFGRGK